MSIKIEKKIKGYSVSRPDPQPAPAASAPLAAVDQEPDRRLVLRPLPGVAERSLRFPKRPTSLNGFEAWTSDFIRAPSGHKFILCISHYRNGVTHPFEVLCNNQEQPPVASLICQLLSKVLQTNDRAFIRHHLDALKKAVEEPFEITLPHSGKVVTANSVGAAIALVYEAHARYIGYLSDDADEPSPMLSAMSSIREPKSNGQGGRASFDDVRNQSTGDDFTMFVKEAWVEGEMRPQPISVWFAGKNVPRECEAIEKLASLAMRHRDTAWTSMFLDTLRKHHVKDEELGFARVGTRKPCYFGSTYAYVAELLLHRYQELGLLDEHGQPTAQRSLFDLEPANDAAPAIVSLHPTASSGLDCPDCRSKGSVQVQSGCPVCGQCGWSRC